MLKGEVRKKCMSLLKKLEVKELLSLVDTVTNKKIQVESRDEAVRMLLDFSQSPLDLLKRRKLRCDMLFQHLVSCGVCVSPNSTKKDLIQAVLQAWNVDCTADDFEVANDELNLSSDNSSSENSQEVAGVATHPPQGLPVNHSSTHISIHVNLSTHLDVSGQTQATGELCVVQQFAEQFTRWFYDILNQSVTEDSQFGPQHFFENATLSLFLQSSSVQTEEIIGSESICRKLSQFVTMEKLSFKPNVERVEGQTDSFGRCVINVCGTLHQLQKAVGLFEQQFSLIENPDVANNWRIKFTKLKMQAVDLNANASQLEIEGGSLQQAVTQGSCLSLAK